MAVVLSTNARALFELLPVSYGDIDDPDPIVARWLEAQAFELARLSDIFALIRSTSIPAVADDSVGALSRWEYALRLPVAPTGRTITARRSLVLAALRARTMNGGSDFTANMTAFADPDALTIRENAPQPYQLTITENYPEAGPELHEVQAYAQRIAPANLEVVVGYNQGWLAGISRAGDLA